jgi:hypothetical protein
LAFRLSDSVAFDFSLMFVLDGNGALHKGFLTWEEQLLPDETVRKPE